MDEIPIPQARKKVTNTDMLLSALHVVLDHVDYTKNNCAVTEMVGAVLPKGVIQQAREAIKVAQSARYSQSSDELSPKSVSGSRERKRAMTRSDIAKLSDEEANVMIAELCGYERLEIGFSSHHPVIGFEKGKHGLWQTPSSIKWSSQIEEQEIKCVGDYFVHLETGNIYPTFDGPDNGIFSGLGNFSYCSDLNACTKFQENASSNYWHQLADDIGCRQYGSDILQAFRLIGIATARQRVEAFLATIGKDIR